MREHRVLRRASSNQYVQTVFHAAGGAGAGLLLAPLLQYPIAVVLGLALLAAAILGHWYAVWSDPDTRGVSAQ